MCFDTLLQHSALDHIFPIYIRMIYSTIYDQTIDNILAGILSIVKLWVITFYILHCIFKRPCQVPSPCESKRVDFR